MLGRVTRLLKVLARHLPLVRQAKLVRLLLPRRFWFRAALAITRFQGRLISRMGGNGVFTTAVMLDLWLRELSFGGAYPIPYRATGEEVILAPGPKLYTWTHLPLTEVPMRAALEIGIEPPAVVADPGNIVGQSEVLVLGSEQRVEAIPADEQLLRRVRTRLAAGKPVVFLADHYLGGPLSDVPLRLAALMRVPLLFQWAELAEDGVVDITYRAAPRPLMETDEDLAENLEFLRRHNREALLRLGWRRD